MYCINSVPNRSIGTSPFHVLYGTHMRLKENVEVRELIAKEWIMDFQKSRNDVQEHAK